MPNEPAEGCIARAQRRRRRGRHLLHRFAEGERLRHRADERIVGRVEDRIEARGLDVDTFLLEVAVKTLLPGDAVGVQSAPEVEEHGGVHDRILRANGHAK